MLFFWKSLHIWGHKYHRTMYLNISLNLFSVSNPFWSFFVQYLQKNAVFGSFLVHPGFFFNGTGLPQIWILISRAHTHKNPVLSQFWEIESIFVKSQDSLPVRATGFGELNPQVTIVTSGSVAVTVEWRGLKPCWVRFGVSDYARSGRRSRSRIFILGLRRLIGL